MSQIKIDISETIKTKLQMMAKDEGLSFSAHCRRIIYLYVSNAAEFERFAASIKVKQAIALHKVDSSRS